MIKQYIKSGIKSVIILTIGFSVPVIYHTKKYDEEQRKIKK